MQKKGGVGKTTTAVHLAAYFQTIRPTVLLDGDTSHNAIEWSERGPGVEFGIVDMRNAFSVARDYEHFISDTPARPSDDDLKYIAQSSDLLVVPTSPRPFDIDGLKQTLQAFQRLNITHYKVLLTACPPPNEAETQQLTDQLMELAVPTFSTSIPRLKAFLKASGEGVLVRDIKEERAQRGWAAYATVAKECLSYGR